MEQLKIYDNQLKQQTIKQLSKCDNSSNEESTESSQEGIETTSPLSFKDWTVFIPLIACLVMISLFVSYHSVPVPLVICNDTKNSVEIIERINWREKYITECCLLQFGIRHLDCLADDVCGFYLSEWLSSINLTKSLKRCCYHYRPFGSDFFEGYCSLQCLNSEKA